MNFPNQPDRKTLARAGRWAGCCLALAAAVAILARQSVRGVPLVTTTIVASDDPFAATSAENPQSPPQGFVVPRADSHTIDRLEDFDRFVSKKAWERALHTINELMDADPNAMVPADHGFMFPIEMRVKRSLLRLPPEGRDAYRLFNDANARQLWASIQNPGRNSGQRSAPNSAASPAAAPPADELATLRKLASRYFLTSVGDLAADRLADALFEQGDFSGAEHLWSFILREYPDSHLSPAKLRVKQCVALARLGRPDQLAAVAAQLREQSAGQKVTIGGREVDAADFAQSLLSRQPQNPAGSNSASANPASPNSAGAAADSLRLPAADDALWQIHIITPDVQAALDQQAVVSGQNVFFRPNGNVPAAAVDGKRLYVNWFGVVYAADLQTGKMLWRSGKFIEAAQKAATFLQYGMSLNHFGLSVQGDRVFAMQQDPPNTQPNAPSRLQCFDAATGKSLWTTDSLGVAVVSTPYIMDGTAFLAGVNTADGNMSLVAIHLDSGQQDWKLDLGKPAGTPNNRGGTDISSPAMLGSRGMLYVATNNGALLAVNPSDHRLQWAFQHDTKPIGGEQRVFFGGMQVVEAETPCTLLDDQGTTYLKDSSARLLYALDCEGPSVKWKRPISTDETVIGIEGQIAWLLGDDLSALDLKSQKLLWCVKIPANSTSLRPIVGPRDIFVASSRGIYDVDRASGDVKQIFRGADRDAAGGRLFVAGDKLICVTDMAVTAYPLASRRGYPSGVGGPQMPATSTAVPKPPG